MSDIYKCNSCGKSTDKPFMAKVFIEDVFGRIKFLGQTITCPYCGLPIKSN